MFGTLVRPIQRFFKLEAASGVLLLAAAVASLIWANQSAATFERVFGLRLQIGVGTVSLAFSVRELVNDGLMTLFFFVVGMEIKRELVLGELRTFGRAALPAVAALGGMLVPAGVYLAFNPSGPAHHGWGIPMATDIAFSIGVLTLLRKRVPQGLVVFLTALAIFDDIGGILVIALFYGQRLHILWMAAAAAVALMIFVAGRRSVAHGVFYLVAGALLWYCLHESGIHATISGVVLGLAIPGRLSHSPREVLRELTRHTQGLMEQTAEVDPDAVSMIRDRLEQLASPLARFIHRMHPLVAFCIMPAFALANSGIPLRGMGAALTAEVALGTALGLLLGKPIGIFIFTVVAVRAGLAPIPGGASAVKLLGTAAVGGIGFTVAIFIASLAFSADASLLNEAKLGILLGSLASGVLGAAILRATPLLSTYRGGLQSQPTSTHSSVASV